MHPAMSDRKRSEDNREQTAAPDAAAKARLREALDERDRALAALQTIEETYRSLFDNAQIGLFRTHIESGRMVECNQRTALIFGYEDRASCLAESNAWKLYEDPHDREKMIAQLRREGQVRNHDVPMRRIDGIPIWARFSGRITPDGEHLEGVIDDVTALREADAARQLAADIVHHVPTGVFIYQFIEPDRLVLIDANPEAARRTGVCAADIGREITAVWPGIGESGLHEQYLRVMRSGDHFSAFNLHYQDARIDGTYRIVAFRMAGNRLGVFFEDMADIKRAEDALRLSEERYRTLTHAINDMVSVHDLDAKLLYVSPSFERTLGWKNEDVVDRSAYEFIHPEEQDKAHRLQHRCLEGSVLMDQLRLRRNDGSWLWVECNISPMTDGQGKVYQILVSSRDITERRQAEEQRQQFENQLQHMQKLESLGVMAGGIAHDFNNLLMGILGNAGLALMELPRDSPSRETIHHIEQAAMRAADLTRQMLAYSGRGRFIIQPIELTRLIEEMNHLLRVSVARQAALRFELAPNLPSVEADPSQLQQVLMNLVINASDAIGDRPGIITVRTGLMNCDQPYLHSAYICEELEPGPYVYLEVGDTGCGMDRETQARIFDPFFTTKFTGRGLGLAAVIGIVRGHHGTVKVYSEPGQGSNFKILFPAGGRSAEPAQADDLAVNTWHGSGMILVVDDEDSVRSVTVSILRAYGLEVEQSASGNDALEKYRADPERYTLVLLDMTMPGMSGDETFREMRRINPRVRVLLSSGYNESDVTGRFAGKGLAGFIQKPYKPADLIARLREILEPTGQPGIG